VDAAVPKVATFQAVACALIFRGGVQVDRVVSAAGRRTPPEVERFALQLGISAAVSRGCQRLVVFSDSMPAVETLLDTSPQSGQIFSLDACKALRPWFAGDGGRSLTMWHVPSRWEWGVHKKAHDAAASVKISVGARPRTSRDFWVAEVDTHSSRDSHSRFSEPSYRGQNFLDLEGSKKNSSLLPSTLKGGPWLRAMGTETSSFARLCRCVTNHAPLGAYRMRFNIAGPVACECLLDVPVQTRDHVLRICPRYKRKKHRMRVRRLPQLVVLLNDNPASGSFATALPRKWDPR
jgi:Reverse transcriptase-like